MSRWQRMLWVTDRLAMASTLPQMALEAIDSSKLPITHWQEKVDKAD